MKKLAFLLTLLIALPALAWDKAPTAQKRLEILAGAAKRLDQGELASCFAPPFDRDVGQLLFENTFKFERGLTELYKVVGEKLGPESVQGVGFEDVSPLVYLAGTTIAVVSVKEEPDKVIAKITYATPDNPETKNPQDLLLVKVGDDWRVVLDHEPWPASLGMDAVSDASSWLDKAATEFENIRKGVQEDKLTSKEQIAEPIARCTRAVKDSWAKLRAARKEAIQAEKDKVAAAAAEAAKKEADSKKAADDAAKAEAAKKDAAKKEAAAREAAAKAPPPPPVTKKKEEAPPEEEKKPEPDNTGTYVVFGILGVACLGTVGMLLSKLSGDKKGRSGGGGKRGGSSRGSSGRNRGGSGKKRRRSSSGDEDDS